MPFRIIRATQRGRCFRVVNAKTRRVYAKCTTKTKAERQMRLLRSLERIGKK